MATLGAERGLRPGCGGSTRGGGGALIVRPFYERYFNSSDVLPVSDVNRFGISLGASILF